MSGRSEKIYILNVQKEKRKKKIKLEKLKLNF